MNTERQTWLNGKLIPESSATVPLLSHSFSRASAIFEIFRIHSGPDGPAAFRMREHLKRLLNSSRFLEMTLCYTTEEITKAVSETVVQNGVESGVVKILAYWGEEAVIGLLPRFDSDMAIFAVPETTEMHLDNSEPVTTCLSKWRKIDPGTVPVEAKACSNYLNAYLARKDADQRGFDIGIMLGTDGLLAEGSTESVFIIKDDVIQVPPLGRVLASVSRMSVLEMAANMGFKTDQKPLQLADLQTADEIFLSHTGAKVEPVCRFEENHLVAPGPITRQLMAQMQGILNFKVDAYKSWMEPL